MSSGSAALCCAYKKLFFDASSGVLELDSKVSAFDSCVGNIHLIKDARESRAGLLNFCRVVADSVAAQLHSPFSGFLGPQVSAASKFHDVGCRSDLCFSSEARGSHCSVHATEFRSRAPLHHFVFCYQLSAANRSDKLQTRSRCRQNGDGELHYPSVHR